VSAALALLASLLWGTSDFVRGSLSRRLRTVQVLATSQALAAVVLVGFVVVSGAWQSPGSWLGWSLASGVTWVLGMGCLYSALARGTMGVVAPIASCGMALPVVLGLLAGERPTALQLGGVAVAVLGVMGSAGPDLRRTGTPQRRAVLLALAAAALFGVEIFSVARGSTSSVAMTLIGMRLSAVACLGALLLARPAERGPVSRGDLAPLLALGCLDLAATAAYALAASAGLVSLVAVLASLYPAVTALLARRLLSERLSGVQRGGVAAVLAGAALIGLAGGTA
jgi:drug/metabolite transporter (DMT)-like permease